MEDRRIAKILSEWDRLSEKAEVLAGERTKLNAAVRISDMQPIMDLRRDVGVKEISAPPTADDFNALLNEIRELRLSITMIGESLSAKTRS